MPVTDISVALCTYNGGRFLREQLESLASQSVLPAELQVGDDGSTDNTLEIVEEFARTAPFPVGIARNERQLGYGENFIQTARRCSSEWIAFCDQDDVWNANKLARCSAEMGEGVSLIVHKADGDLSPLQHHVNPPLSVFPRWYYYGFCQVFHRRILSFERRRLPWAVVQDAHDVWVPFVAGMIGTIIWINEPLATYRQHGGNVSKTLPKLQEGGITFIDSASEIASGLGLIEAERRYRRFASRLRRRAELRQSRNPLQLVRLLLSGAYRSGGFDCFGKRGLLSDAKRLLGG